MKVLVVGETGVVGRQLVPQLLAAGHDVLATSHRASPSDDPRQSVGRPVDQSRLERIRLNLLDPAAVTTTISAAEPDLIVHQATALRTLGNNTRSYDRLFDTTNRLRTDGTAALLMAARDAGSPPVVVQSFCGGWTWKPVGSPVKDEDDPYDDAPATEFAGVLRALRELEEKVRAYPAVVVLRYGYLYGPGTSLGMGGPQIQAVKDRRLPLVGSGAGIWSFLHVADAAAAALAAADASSGVFNIVDDEPAPVSEWLPHLAKLLGARPPRRIPVWLARLIAGGGAAHMMTRSRGSSNAKARRELDWEPQHPSWRMASPPRSAQNRTDGERHALRHHSGRLCAPPP